MSQSVDLDLDIQLMLLDINRENLWAESLHSIRDTKQTDPDQIQAQ